MYKVMKRDGTIAEFDIAKISKAITKAFEAEKCEFHPTVIDLLALKVTSDFSAQDQGWHHQCGGYSGQRGARTEPGRLYRRSQGLYSVPQAA